MRRIVLAAAVLTLAGCSTPPPVQVGKDKFAINHGMIGTEAALASMQPFCRQEGYDYAELVENIRGVATFFCMRNGDRLTSPSAPKVCVGVTNCN